MTFSIYRMISITGYTKVFTQQKNRSAIPLISSASEELFNNAQMHCVSSLVQACRARLSKFTGFEK